MLERGGARYEVAVNGYSAPSEGRMRGGGDGLRVCVLYKPLGEPNITLSLSLSLSFSLALSHVFLSHVVLIVYS